MEKTYYLEDVTIAAHENPRHFTIPTDAEIEQLQVGKLVRLFFALNFKPDDGCRAERMWVEISEINGNRFSGYLTNKPVYIQELAPGDVIHFEKQNIASILLPHWPDETKMAIITRKALDARSINWLLRDKPNNPQDSGWQLFYGDEDEAYLSDAKNATIISLGKVLEFEPRLEQAFTSDHTAFEWNEEAGDFVKA